MKQLVIVLFSLIGLLSCERDYNNDYKDFTICVTGTDYAKIKIINYSDSSFVNSIIYDANELGTNSEGYNCLHLSTLKAGKYIVSGYCPYQNLKHNEVTTIVDYSGNYKSITLDFY